MRYVTCYDSILSGLTDVTFHMDKESAIKFYRKEAKCYFGAFMPTLPKKIDVPTACGFEHRRFMVMSIKKFNSLYPEYKGKEKRNDKQRKIG